MEELAANQAEMLFLEECTNAMQVAEFPWKRLLSLGRLAGFEREITLEPSKKGQPETVSFYVATILSSVLNVTNASAWRQVPKVTQWQGTVSVNGPMYGRMNIGESCKWFPMFLTLALKTQC